MEEQSLTTGNDVVDKIYFNKGCDCANWINEQALPDYLEAPSWDLLAEKCIDALAATNTNLGKYANAMKNFRVHIREGIKNKDELRVSLVHLCDGFEACHKFISLEEVKECLPCDGNVKDPKETSKKKKEVSKKKDGSLPKNKVKCVKDNDFSIQFSLKRLELDFRR